MGADVKINLVPNYLKAKTPDLLRESMLSYNIQKSQYTEFINISLQSDGYWYAWFYEADDLYEQITPKVVKR